MEVSLASAGVGSECELVLRDLPAWFGIESALLQYAADAEKYPTLVARESSALVGFITVRQHFEHSFEVHCMAVQAGQRRRGLGSRLLKAAESWAQLRGGRFMQVKTISPGNPSPEYAETRAFYFSAGYAALEEFPLLWSKSNPCLQLVKAL
ncbi:GNAT family N-acetyltransferase [Ideonella sp. DXS29W]|uniref:GNAT family N-acetyltransferase n=1 Tax=Ideonella lacteola TaxID=2984193 RepID=A0ABU9C145_9BURK